MPEQRLDSTPTKLNELEQPAPGLTHKYLSFGSLVMRCENPLFEAGYGFRD